MMDKQGIEELNIHLKRIVKTSVIVFIGIFISKILAYTYRIIVARYFGPEIYGLFSLALVILGLFISVSSLGLSEGLLRFIPVYRGRNDQNRIRYFIKLSSKIFLILGIISAALMFLLSEFISINIFHNELLIPFIQIFSILIPISLLLNLFLSIIRAYEKISAYSFIFNILQNIAKLLAIILLIFIGIKSNAVIFSYIIAIAIMLIASYLYCRYKLVEVFGKYILNGKAKSLARKELFSYSIPLMFAAVTTLLFYWVDSLSIGYFKTAADVGFYNVAVPIAMLFYLTPEIFMQLFFPLINKEYSKGNTKLINDLSKQIGKWIFIINLPALIIMLFFPGVIINILFGKEYLVAETALRILAVGAFFNSLSTISYNLVSMAGKSKLLLSNIISFSILNLILNIILVPKYGINGAAIATSISYLLMSIVLFAESKKFVSILPLKRKMTAVLLASIIPTAILFFLQSIIEINLFTLIALGLSFFIFYVLIIFLIKGFDERDIMIMKSAIKKLTGKDLTLNYFRE